MYKYRAKLVAEIPQWLNARSHNLQVASSTAVPTQCALPYWGTLVILRAVCQPQGCLPSSGVLVILSGACHHQGVLANLRAACRPQGRLSSSGVLAILRGVCRLSDHWLHEWWCHYFTLHLNLNQLNAFYMMLSPKMLNSKVRIGHPCLPVSLSPCLPVSLSPCLTLSQHLNC